MANESDAARRWGPVVERLRSRLSRAEKIPASVEQSIAEAAATCDTLLQELAASQLEIGGLKRTIGGLRAEWVQLFDAMPTPCLVTDLAGRVLRCNAMAAQLLNMSARHLENRVITLFIQDRDAFISTLNELRHRTHRLAATFVVRPRERAAVTLDMVAVPVVPGETATWLWFLSRSTEPLRTRQQPSPSVNLESR